MFLRNKLSFRIWNFFVLKAGVKHAYLTNLTLITDCHILQIQCIYFYWQMSPKNTGWSVRKTVDDVAKFQQVMKKIWAEIRQHKDLDHCENIYIYRSSLSVHTPTNLFVVLSMCTCITFHMFQERVAEYIPRVWRVVHDYRVQWSLDLTKDQTLGQLVRFIEASLYWKPGYNQFVEKQPKCSLFKQ